MSDAERWDKRYRSGEAPEEPNSFLREHHSLLPQHAQVLDVACGAGRNTIYLAQLGNDVTGVDYSAEGLLIARRRAHAAGVNPALVLADLEQWVPPQANFDLITCFYYLNRSIWQRLSDALRPDGLLMVETYTTAQLAFKPQINPDFLLQPGELAATFAGWQILVSREAIVDEPGGRQKAIASLLARKAAGE